MWTPRSDGCTTAERLRAARRRETAKLYENTYELRRRGYICDESGATNACHRRALENKEGNRSGCVTEEVADIRHQEPAADVMVSIDERGSIKEGECQNVEGPQGLYTTGSFRRTSTVSVSTVEQPIKLLDAAWSRYDTQQVPRWSVSGRKADKHRKNRAPTLSRPSSGPFVRSHMGSASSSKRVGAAPSTALPARLNCFPHVPNPSEGTSVPPSTSATTVSLTPASGKVDAATPIVPMSQNRQLLYPREEMVSLVRSLDRPQENGLFSQDVLLQYPELAESYTKVCPNRCDLATAADRAAKGAYGYDVQLTTLKEDIRLMVNNCILFNGAEGAYADAARTFEKFAMGKIDAYISQKVGGRRLSSFRVASVSVPEKHSTGKRGRDGESRERGPEAVDNDSSRRQPGRGNGIATSEDDSNRRSAELIKLIDSLNRREDDGAFAVDVAEAYPELKSAYEAMCPLKMNLIIMKERAQNGYYLGQQHRRRRTGDDPTLYMGSSIAESLTSLRDDVELMVRNCVNFNAGVVEWERRAASFHHFAHKKIDDFVLRIDPSLRGTRTGVEVYVQEAKKMQQSQLKQKIEGSERSNRGDVGAPENVAQSISPPSHTTATPMNPPRKATIPGTARIPTLSAHVNVVNTVTPIVQPTALQPVFNTPSTLRRRLISDHLHRETLHARLIHRLENDKSGTNGVPEIDRSGDAPQMYEPALSCRAVLDAFIISVRDFHKAQRESQDFVNPFMYAQQEENLYCDYVTLIKQQLERLFLHIVLYNREKAEMYDWAAAKAAQMAVADASLLPTAPAVSSHVSCCWLDEAHLCYLVRFLQHLPQLLGLACAEVDTAKSDGTGNAQLYLTTVEQGVVGKIAKITEELLSFIARYEEKITASHQNSESLKEQAEAPAL